MINQKQLKLPLTQVQRTVGACLVASVIGILVFITFALSPDRFSTHSRILLLSPQERYLGGEALETSNGGLVGDKVEQEARLLLSTETMLMTLTKHYGLAEQAYFQRQPIWQTVSNLIGLEFWLSNDPTHDNLLNETSISYHKDRSVLEIGFRAPTPELATVIANTLAQTYLEMKKTRQIAELSSVIAKLEGEANRLQTLLASTKAATIASQAPENLNDETRAEWDAIETKRIEQVNKRAEAEKRMHDHVLVRLQEARTRQKLDLLPPNARLLATATMPEMPDSKNAWLFAVLAALATLASSSLYLFRLDVARLFRRKREKTPALPFQLTDAILDGRREPVSSNEAVALQECSDHLGDAGERQKGEGPSEPEFSSASPCLITRVADAICEVRPKRLVFMSEEQSAASFVEQFTGDLCERGIATAIVSLRDQKLVNQGAVGLTDLIDERAAAVELVTMGKSEPFTRIGVGYRTMQAEDFFCQDLHLFLLALEETYDMLIIDIGEHFENEYALKTLGVAPDALACIHAPDTPLDTSKEVDEVMRQFGYKGCLIISEALEDADGEIRSIAAE